MLKTFEYKMINIDVYNSGYYISQLESVTWSFVSLLKIFLKYLFLSPCYIFILLLYNTKTEQNFFLGTATVL